MSKKTLSDEQWRTELTPEAYAILRQGATERPFSSDLVSVTPEGHYHCAGCDALLFTGATQFDAGCGWPSFWDQAHPDRIVRLTDTTHGMVRVEVRCALCDGHLGHVFPDGPEPTGERYCINGRALQLKTDETV